MGFLRVDDSLYILKTGLKKGDNVHGIIDILEFVSLSLERFKIDSIDVME